MDSKDRILAQEILPQIYISKNIDLEGVLDLLIKERELAWGKLLFLDKRKREIKGFYFRSIPFTKKHKRYSQRLKQIKKSYLLISQQHSKTIQGIEYFRNSPS